MSYNPEWFRANRDRINANARRRRRLHPDKIRAQQRAVKKRMRNRSQTAIRTNFPNAAKIAWANQHSSGWSWL